MPTLLATLLVATPAAAAPLTPVASTLTSPNPVDTTPHAQNGDVKAFAEIGNTVYVGGSFTGVKPAGGASWTAQSYLFAYDRATGALKTGFTPDLDGAVHSLAVNPDGKLVVGGAFKNVNGVARLGLVALDPATGATVGAFVGRADGGLVRRAIVRGNQLYIAGAFHWVNGTYHSLLARLNATTGAIDPTFQIDAAVARTSSELVWGLDVTPDNGTLVAVGNFTEVNGLARNQVVLVELAGTPTVANWSTQRYVHPCSSASFPFYARDVDFSDDGSHFVIVADGGLASGAYCDSIARFETDSRGSAIDGTWVNYTGHDSVTSVEVADDVVYVAGHFRWLNNANGNDKAGPGAIDRYGYGALDPINGMPLSWNPGRSGAPSGTTNWGPIVWELWRGSTGIHAGFDNDGTGGEYHGRQAVFPLAGGRVVPAVNAPLTTPGYLYLGGTSGQLTRVSFDGASTLGTPSVVSQPNLTSAGAAFALSNKLFWSKTDAAAPSGSTLQVSMFTGGTVGAPWLSSGFNSWFAPATMTGAFYLNGRMYYTRSGQNKLFFRYLEPDGSTIGCTEFTVPSQGVDWSRARGLTFVDGRIVYGNRPLLGLTNGDLWAVPFDETAVDGSAAVRIAQGASGTDWSNATLFYATS
ncbi:delta-60 repeat domain-containing protein [Micromonospora sp. WMMD882]|uniref:delta-60 repeat domain-containing protein n=1 Tax=Micromonospora sp. WMMD882 TaxID=3015151 RepID=UPI00248C4491|nr:delta-60 repeat domain-containing protein [Micromonospora sp. WMMD882]WBB77288.1 delta-60 repeat domain-containing protein [Micromonospora sp. WMMD882]